MTNVLAPPLSQTLEHVYADGRVETLTFDEFIPAHEIDSRIADMAAYLTPLMIERPDDTVVAEIMSGATQTVDDVMIDVTKLAPNVKVKMVPLKISSYTGEEGGRLHLEQDAPKGVFAGKRVFVFDEVIDRAESMVLALDRILSEGPEKVIVVSLTRKPDAHTVDIPADVECVVGFDVSNRFLLGRGMDWHGQGRFLRNILRKRDGQDARYTLPPFPTYAPLRGAVLLG